MATSPPVTTLSQERIPGTRYSLLFIERLHSHVFGGGLHGRRRGCRHEAGKRRHCPLNDASLGARSAIIHLGKTRWKGAWRCGVTFDAFLCVAVRARASAVVAVEVEISTCDLEAGFRVQPSASSEPSGLSGIKVTKQIYSLCCMYSNCKNLPSVCSAVGWSVEHLTTYPRSQRA